MTTNIILYGHATCPMVRPIKGIFVLTRIPYTYVNIRQDPTAAERVRKINNGNESVPTLVFPDESTLTEPTVAELKAKLATLGYKVGWAAWLVGHSWHIFMGCVILFAILRFFEIL